ncbi:hypothetical protein [Streptomyces sp. NPDC059398]|uniref:hypothetical protein n=1 Tax=Streptomyces sp. NPDC059398 TaxID=3346820 RepID=UPI0036810BF9
MRETRTDTKRPGATEALSPTVVLLALVGAVLCAAVLLFVRFAHWAGAHPVAATVLALLAVPVLSTLFRAMPGARELRRAARAGMARADRGLTGTAPAVEAATPCPAPRASGTTGFSPLGARDGLTAVMPEPAPELTGAAPAASDDVAVPAGRRSKCGSQWDGS